MSKQAKFLSNNPRRRHWPLSLIAAALIVLIAAGAIFYLHALTALYEKAARLSAAKSTIDYGANISQWLAEQFFFQGAQNEKDGPGNPPVSAQDFNRTVDWLQKMENAVQYVAVREDNVVLYQRQMAAGGATTEEGIAGPRKPRRGQTAIGRKKLILGTNIVPVITFSITQMMPDGHKRELEIGLNKGLIDRQSAGAASALKKIYHIALATIVIGFGACLAAIIALLHREMVWQKRSRLDEHLAFAGAMAGSVIHDFRNPLSAMRLDSQLLQGEAAKGSHARPERLRELAERVVKTIDRVDGLLAEFLALAKPDANEPQIFDVNESILDCVELLKIRFEKAGFNLAADLAKERLQVRGFPAQFKRALLNILTNAEQFSPPSGRVTAQTRMEKNRAVIKITDEGPGVPPRERNKIFDLFYSNRAGGTGIGLALARAAIENCGGEIECPTPPGGKGALFVIRIPLSV